MQCNKIAPFSPHSQHVSSQHYLLLPFQLDLVDHNRHQSSYLCHLSLDPQGLGDHLVFYCLNKKQEECYNNETLSQQPPKGKAYV